MENDRTKYDLMILGGGPAGYVAALNAAGNGLKTALVEMDAPGGMCLNWGCIPSKTLIQSAKFLEISRKAAEYGISGIDADKVRPDWPAMQKRSKKIVKKLTKGVDSLLKNRGVHTIRGYGEIYDRNIMKVGSEKYEFEHLIIATGSHYRLPPEFKELENTYSIKEIYNIPELPEKMIIIGAGTVGVEFALLFAALDVKVKIVDKSKLFMPYLDDEVRRELMQTMKKQGIEFHADHRAGIGAGRIEIFDRDGEALNIGNDWMTLWATERRANLKGLEFLMTEGLETSKPGYIKCDEFCRTNLNKVYAVGDVNGKIMLAHVASKEGSTAVDHILGKAKALNYDLIPYNLYARQEIASVGITEEQARAQGYNYRAGRFNFLANGKALAEDNASGFVKIIHDTQYGEILGVHIIAENATDLISEAALAMQSEASIEELAMVTHPHPTLSEALLEAGLKSLGRPLH